MLPLLMMINIYIDDVGSANEYLPEKNNYDDSTGCGGSVCDTFGEDNETINLHGIVWLKNTKAVFKVKVIRFFL